MNFEEVVKMIEESNKKVDEVLKAAKLQRTPKQPMSQERLTMILNYVVGIVAIFLGFIIILVLMYYLNH
jgi:hypothetical protein